MRLLVSKSMHLLLLVSLASIGISSIATASQTGTSSDPYKTELLDWTIAVSGPNYTLVNVALEEYPHGRGERIYIASVESKGFAEIALFDDEDSPEQTIDLMLRDFDAASQHFTVVEQGEMGGVHFALARFVLTEGPTGYFYIEVAGDIDGNVDLSQSFYSLDTDFVEQIGIARSEISFDGLAFLQEPAVDLEQSVADDQAQLAATPQVEPTPHTGTFAFDSSDAELDVQAPISFDFQISTPEFDLKYLQSQHGYAVVGYVIQDAESAVAVMESVFLGAPGGAEAPRELYLESSHDRAFGVYRVQYQDTSRALVIEITSAGDQLWLVQAIAVTESEFSSELATYQSSVRFGEERFLGNVDAEVIVSILRDNQS